MSWFSWLLWGFQSHWPEHRFSFTPVGVDSSFVPAPFGSQLVFFLTNSIKIEKNKHVFLFLFYNQLPFETFKFGKVKTAMNLCCLFLKLKKMARLPEVETKPKLFLIIIDDPTYLWNYGEISGRVCVQIASRGLWELLLWACVFPSL